MSTPQPGTDGHAHGSLHNPDVAHEASDINVSAVIWFLVTLVVVAVVVQLSIGGLFRILDRIETKNDLDVSPLAIPAGQLPPQPRLQTTPWQDLKGFRAAEDQELGSYGWIDEKNGVAHIPIDKAKEMILQRGLPTRAETANGLEGTPVASSGDANGGRSIPAGLPDRSSPPVKKGS
jgi:hypothetical protein